MKERLKASYGNDVWERRKKPPEDWNAPLPKWIEEENKNTYLYIKKEQKKGKIVNVSETSSCVIS